MKGGNYCSHLLQHQSGIAACQKQDTRLKGLRSDSIQLSLCHQHPPTKLIDTTHSADQYIIQQSTSFYVPNKTDYTSFSRSRSFVEFFQASIEIVLPYRVICQNLTFRNSRKLLIYLLIKKSHLK